MKRAVGRHAAMAMHPQRARQAIEVGVTSALRRLDSMQRFDVGAPLSAPMKSGGINPPGA